jgi:uncharacterized protein DUF6900
MASKNGKAEGQRAAEIERIAKEHLGIDTLISRNRDHLDFHKVSVGQLSKALTAAWEAGRRGLVASGQDAGSAATDAAVGALEAAARQIVKLLGEETAAAIAGKCQATYGSHPADLESAKLCDAIVRVIGLGRYNQINVL